MSGVLGPLAFIYGGEALWVSCLPAVNKVGLQNNRNKDRQP